MTWHFVRRLLLAGFLTASWGAGPLSAQGRESIVANNNRESGGELRDGVLTLRLELRNGIWHPESEEGEAIPVYAFGEAGKPLQAPAPLVRVPQGTVVEVSVHNTLAVPATLHGLHERPGDAADVVTVQPGAKQEVRFKAGARFQRRWRVTPCANDDVRRRRGGADADP